MIFFFFLPRLFFLLSLLSNPTLSDMDVFFIISCRYFRYFSRSCCAWINTRRNTDFVREILHSGYLEEEQIM